MFRDANIKEECKQDYLAHSGVVESFDQAADLVLMIRFNLKLSGVLWMLWDGNGC
jgi:hypothetical protein